MKMICCLTLFFFSLMKLFADDSRIYCKNKHNPSKSYLKKKLDGSDQIIKGTRGIVYDKVTKGYKLYFFIDDSKVDFLVYVCEDEYFPVPYHKDFPMLIEGFAFKSSNKYFYLNGIQSLDEQLGYGLGELAKANVLNIHAGCHTSERCQEEVTSKTQDLNKTCSDYMVRRKKIIRKLKIIDNALNKLEEFSGFRSDRQIKKNIQPLSHIMEKLNTLDGVSYQEVGKLDRTYGLIAQQVEMVFPELVEVDGEGYLTVDYRGMIPVLTEAINIIKQRLDALEVSIQLNNI